MIEKRGDAWCVIHTYGPNEGRPIKCFPTEKEAINMEDDIITEKPYGGGSTIESGSEVYKFDYIFDINKSFSNDRLYIYGVASTEDKDRDGEIVSMKSLEKAFQKYMRRNPLLMYQHDGKVDAVGKVIPEFTGEDGTVYKSGVINNELRIVGMISQADSVSDIRTQIKEGILKAFSIGGKARKVRKGEALCVLISDLMEISIVTVPVNEQAMFNVIKSVCYGDNCPAHNKIIEDTTMEKEDIVMLVKGIIDEKAIADSVVALQKQYDTLKTDADKSAGEYTELQKKYAALEATKEGDGEGGEEHEENVVKGMMAKIDLLRTELESMKTTPIKKGIQDGEEIVEKGVTDITSAIMARHYGSD